MKIKIFVWSSRKHCCDSSLSYISTLGVPQKNIDWIKPRSAQIQRVTFYMETMMLWHGMRGLWNINTIFQGKTRQYSSRSCGCYCWHFFLLLSKPQLNHNSTQPNITLSWVRHENDFAHTPPPHRNSMSTRGGSK